MKSSSKTTTTKSTHGTTKTTRTSCTHYEERSSVTTHYSKEVLSSKEVNYSVGGFEFYGAERSLESAQCAKETGKGGGCARSVDEAKEVVVQKPTTSPSLPCSKAASRIVSFKSDPIPKITHDIEQPTANEGVTQGIKIDHAKPEYPVDKEKTDGDEAFKEEQKRRFKEGHLSTLINPPKAVRTWEVKKLPISKCKDGHSPNWFAYGANVYALDNVHRRGYLPNVYGPPEHHLEAGEIVYEIDRTVEDGGVWIKHKFWSRETERWRTGWTKANWMNRIRPGGILSMSQSYQGK